MISNSRAPQHLIRIVVDQGLGVEIVEPLLSAFESLGISALLWSEGDLTPIKVDTVVTCSSRLTILKERFFGTDIVILAASPTAIDTRRWLASGVVGIIDTNNSAPASQALVALAAATGESIGIPRQHGSEIAVRLEAPPRLLTGEEERMLALAATRSIELAGGSMGWSRRQSQRRFQRLRDDLGLAKHLHAIAVAASRWGIIGTDSIDKCHTIE
ncbi:MAG: hypothetical protein ACRBK7_16455 [Acidimicrobiales bacterium]